MVNASFNFVSLSGIVLFLVWIPSIISAVMKNTRDPLAYMNAAFRGPTLWFSALVLFFQGWRLDPILQLGVTILVANQVFTTVTEVISIRRNTSHVN